MAKGVTGVNQVIAELRKFGKDADKKIGYETEAIAFQIERDAKQFAPKNFGKLAQSISHQKINPLNYKVTVNEMYAAYMEFGTGKKVAIPSGWEQMAASFKGKTGKSFADFVEAMEIWMNAKGYDPANAWIACVNILNNGLEPRPFLYPAWVKGKSDYQKNLKELLKKYNKKI